MQQIADWLEKLVQMRVDLENELVVLRSSYDRLMREQTRYPRVTDSSDTRDAYFREAP